MTIDIFAPEEWAKQRRPGVVETIGKRLSRLSDALGDKPYLDGDAFTAGDLIMTSVLRSLDGKDLLERHSNLVAYKAVLPGAAGLRGGTCGAAGRFRATRGGLRLKIRTGRVQR